MPEEAGLCPSLLARPGIAHGPSMAGPLCFADKADISAGISVGTDVT